MHGGDNLVTNAAAAVSVEHVRSKLCGVKQAFIPALHHILAHSVCTLVDGTQIQSCAASKEKAGEVQVSFHKFVRAYLHVFIYSLLLCASRQV